jgi:hypothetical protein
MIRVTQTAIKLKNPPVLSLSEVLQPESIFMTAYVDEKGVAQPERRKHRYLRDLFGDVVHRVEPFFREGGGLEGQRTDFWVTRTIRETHPDLNNEEVHVLANAAIHYFEERRAGLVQAVGQVGEA